MWVPTEWDPATGTFPFDPSKKAPYVGASFPWGGKGPPSRPTPSAEPAPNELAPSPRLPSPSQYQAAIFDFVVNGRGNAVVNATAGSGKTTTLVEVAHLLPEATRAVFVAFNKSAADQLKDRLPRHVKAQTIHSLGFAALTHHLRTANNGKGELSSNKYPSLCRSAFASSGLERTLPAEQAEISKALLRSLVEQLRNHLVDPGDDDGVDDVIRRHSLPEPRSDTARKAVRKLAWEVIEQGASMALQGVYDYTDMLYAPVTRALPPRSTYDFLCVDEAQDLSPLQLAAVLRVVNDQGRMLFVGDRHQAIYGFTGADPASMQTIIDTTQAQELPLSVSYRCPCNHVNLARQFSPEMEAAPGAAQGIVRTIREDAFARDVEPGALVVCRTNAPIVKACLDLLAAGVPAMLIGSDLSKRLKEFARVALKGGSLTNWEHALDRYYEQRLLALADSSSAEAIIELLEDEVACLKAITRRAVATGARSVDDLSAAIDDLYSVRNGAIRLSTVHRAKGQEADSVYILYPHLMPYSKAVTPEDREAERCVQFVAVTRAKRELVFVEAELNGGAEDASYQQWWPG